MNLINLRREVPGYPNYSVTRDGRIYSKPRPHTSGGWMKIYKADTYGHLGTMTFVNHRHAMLYAHRAVALAWIPNPDNLPCVLHTDHEPTNNHISNLRWGTPADNTRDMDLAGRRVNVAHQGSAHGNAKLTERDIPLIRALLKDGRLTQRQIGQHFGVSVPTINHIQRGISWTHVPDEDTP